MLYCAALLGALYASADATVLGRAGNEPLVGGGPVPLRVFDDDVAAETAGEGVVKSGYIPFNGGGPVPLMV